MSGPDAGNQHLYLAMQPIASSDRMMELGYILHHGR